MKKLFSVILSAILVFTMVIAMPVMADSESVNLVINGDFEAAGDEIGATEFTGWTNTNAENPFVLVANGAGKSAKALNDSDGAQSGTDMPETSMEQTITIDTNADWYKNANDWTYELSYDGYNASRTPGSTVRITLTNTDNVSTVMSYESVDEGGGYWAFTTRTYSLDKQLGTMANRTIKTIKIELMAGIARWNYTNLDNIVIKPVRLSPESHARNLIVNGDFEAADDTVGSTTITGWTNLNAANSYTLIEYGTGKAIKALNDSDGAQSGTDMSDALLEQTVTINTNDPWYTNYNDWTFEVSADGYNAGRVPLASIVVTMTNVAGASSEVEYVAADNGQGYWGWSNRVYDLTDQIEALGPKPLTSIKVKFNSKWRWYYSAFDNVVLMPVYAPKEDTNIAVNGAFDILTEGVPDGWTFENTTQESAYVTDGATSHSGTGYLKFTGAANAGAYQVITGEKGKTYMVEACYTSTAAGAATIQVYDCYGRSYAYQSTKNEAPTAWESVRAVITIGRENTDATFKVRVGSANADATVCFDTLTVTEIEHDYTNLLQNGEFEYDSIKNAEGQNITNWASGNAQKLVNDYKHSGNGAYALRQGNIGIGCVVLYDRTEAEVATGATYKLSFWVNDNSINAMPRGRILFYDMHADASLSGRGNGEFNFTCSPTVVNEWKYEEFIFTTPANCDFLRIDFFGGSGWTRYDDMRLEKVVTSVEITDAEGKVLEELPENVNTTYKANAVYGGTATDAMVYIAEYKTDANGIKRLVKVSCKAIDTNTRTGYTDITVENASADQIMIKAFIWTGDVLPEVSCEL